MKIGSFAVALVLLSAGAAWADVDLGFLFSINGSVSTGGPSEAVSLSVYDKDIHSGSPRVSPCDGMSTDAFVLQGRFPVRV